MNKAVSLLINLKRQVAIRFYSETTLARFYRKEYKVKIGKHCRIIGKHLSLFGSEPYLIELGDYVTIAEGVRFITHDGGISVLRDKDPNLNVFGKIVIKDNCFIGINSILMPNIVIGPNAVVGAGAVVTKNVAPNTVVAGVPAKEIMTLDQYRLKARDKGLAISTRDAQKKKREILAHLNQRR